ncbi:MAG: GntR family transcriptional regulator [Tissierella sp.]|nr:GntR family transcriptional regulator [Tissierella sp.]
MVDEILNIDLLKGRSILDSPVEKVYKTIRYRILNQEYAPSQALVESALAKEFGVGRNTIRRALMQLVNEKLVELEVNKSAVVKFLTKEEALDLLEIRERLEGLITYSTAKVIKKDDVDRIRSILKDMEGLLAEGNLLEYSVKNDIIHDIIDDICPNREAIELIESIRLQLRSFNKRTILIPGRAEESYKEHIELLEALESNDAERSEIIMRKHMASVRNTLIKNYDMLF